jgi:NAD+ synthase
MINSKLLSIDPEQESDRIIKLLQETIRKRMRRYGAVVGISGGIDSSVVLALCVRAFGADHVLAIMMPEKESSPETREISALLATHFGVRSFLEEITPVLSAFGCYTERDNTIRRLFPEYDPDAGYKCKIILPPNLLDSDVLNFFSLAITDPDHTEKTIRLPLQEYLDIVAATNLKQRTRMAFLYFHAEKNNYAVAGTANKNEHDLGFFVKYGDGGADLQPIAHLYKTQVYQLAEYLQIPEVIRNRPPTTDTYSAGSSQQEFFYRLPFELLDTLWMALENCIPIHEAAEFTGLTEIQVQRVWDDIVRKKRTTEYLRMQPVTIYTELG